MPMTGGSIAQREAHAAAMATVTAHILMAQSCTAEQLREWSKIVDSHPQGNVSWVAYELTSKYGAWWVGHMFFVEDVWRIVARQTSNMEGDDFRPLRPMFVAEYEAECARRVRVHFNIPHPEAQQ